MPAEGYLIFLNMSQKDSYFLHTRDVDPSPTHDHDVNEIEKDHVVGAQASPASAPQVEYRGQGIEEERGGSSRTPPHQGLPAGECTSSSIRPLANWRLEMRPEQEAMIAALRGDGSQISRYNTYGCKLDCQPDGCLMQAYSKTPTDPLRAPQPATRLDLGRILQARQDISRVFLDTPQFECIALGGLLDCEIVIKLETANPIGCFKGRGTEVVMSRLARSLGPKAIVCASAGNLGQALAYSGRKHGIGVTVVASKSANTAKIDRIRKLGAAVELVAGDFDAARERAREIVASSDAFLVEDSENLDTCEGAGTIVLELLDGSEPIDTVLLALGGGALAAGVGHVFKTLSPATEVVCVQPKGAPAMAMSWRARSIVTTEHTDTIADGVASRFPNPAVLTDLLAIADHIPLVEEESIVAGMRMLYRHAALVVEPSAALGVAAILEDPLRYRGKRVALVICGSNVLPEAFSAWMQGSVHSPPTRGQQII